MHHCSSGADQLGKEAEGLWLAGSSEPMCSCVLTLFCSFAIVCSDFWLCVQAFPSVLKLPKRLPMCAKSNSQHKDSHLLSANKRSRVQSSSLAFRSGVLWVFCGYANAVPAGCLPCDRACPSPLLRPTGVRAVALRTAFLTHSVNLLPTMSQRHCNSKIRSQFQQIQSTIGLKSS